MVRKPGRTQSEFLQSKDYGQRLIASILHAGYSIIHIPLNG